MGLRRLSRVIGSVIGESVVNDISPGTREVRKEVDNMVTVHNAAIRGTAEFVRSYKKHFHQTGKLNLELPRGAALPPWANIVIETLRLRRKKWKVNTLRGKGGGTTIQVQWLGWLTESRKRGRRA